LVHVLRVIVGIIPAVFLFPSTREIRDSIELIL
jgi:hypothetical protein